VEGAALGVAIVLAATTLIATVAYLFQNHPASAATQGGWLETVGQSFQALLAKSWTVHLAVGTSAASLALLFVMQLRVKKYHHETQEQLASAAAELQRCTNQSKAELANARRSLVSTESARKELEARVISLSESNALFESELDKRRRVESFLAQQRRELVRSKDVLELHVAAREEELAKLQRRNELILNAAGEGICGLALDGTIAFANPAAASITGWQIDELVGNTEERIFRKKLTETTAVQTGKNNDSTQPPVFYRKDGSFLLAEYIKTPIAESGATVGYVLIFRDVTERRQAEQQLEEKAAELSRSNAELEQFAFVASHDLQEPLRKILSFGDRLKAKCDAAQLTDGRDFLERMQNAAARMQTLISDLLTFSRVISRVQPFAAVDLGVVVREVLTDLEVRIERCKARVEVGELPIIDADPVQMRQLIQNLVSNALKFQAPGSTPKVRIQARAISNAAGRASAAANRTKVDGEQMVDWCELTVEDNGIGFDEKYLDRIFAVFQRLHGRQEYEGTGIGLAVCRRIVDRHGGTITACSKPGEGACFIVKVPLRQAEKTEVKP
jgi:PAS domain S-box-containing protein